jgi:hypothetical protein
MANARSQTFVRMGVITLVAVSWLALSVDASAQQAKRTDQEELEALVQEYTRLEDAGDMLTQSKLIAPDRWWHGIGGRRTDNSLWMKVQEEGFANTRKRYPGLRFVREVHDLRVRLIAPTVAITSFTWFANRLIPPDLPNEKVQALGPAPIPQTTSLVWVKQQDGWKIINSHISPLYLRP